MSNDYSLHVGDGAVVTCTVTSGGATLTLTKAWFTVKQHLSDTDAQAKIRVNTTDDPTKIAISNNGTTAPVVTVTLDGTETQDLEPGTYYYDVQVLLQGLSGPRTPVCARVTLLEAVTDARS